MTHTITLPRCIETGAGAIARLADVLEQFECMAPCIISDPMMLQLGYVEQVRAILAKRQMSCGVFTDTEAEPTEASILPAVIQVQRGGYDCLIALGGGSAIDSAKAIAILARYGGVMRDYCVPRIVDELGLPVIAIPTTAGTGSEATRFTVITDAGCEQSSDEKLLCVGLGFMPVAAILDYELTLSAPPRVTADTGIDALTHAIEAYVSKKANPYSDIQALAAIRLIAPNLRQAFNCPADREARAAMLLGAHLGGVAFSNASVALVHGMSRPIGAHFHVPHGLSNAMLLPLVTEFSLPGAPSRFPQCARAMGVANEEHSDAMANQRLLTELKSLNRDLKVPSPRAFGIDLPRFLALRHTMAEQAMASGSPANNPRVPSTNEIAELYEKLCLAD